jgi:beta-galactosidase
MVPIRADWDSYEAVVLPSVYLLDERNTKRVHDYVATGGKLFATYYTGIADGDDHIWLGGYPGSIRDVLGMRSEDFAPLGTDVSGVLDHLNLSNGAVAHDLADVITSVAGSAQVLAQYEAEEWTGMSGIPAITLNVYGEGLAAYVGCRLGREGLARTLPDLLSHMHITASGGSSSASVLRVERVDVNTQEHFVFLFNRTHQDVTVSREGTVLVSSRATVHEETSTATLKANGLLVMKY